MPRATRKKKPSQPVRKKASSPRKTTKPARRAAPASGGGRMSGLTAKDVMVRDVLTVSPSTSVDIVSSLFQLHNINGCPVVDDDGALIGIVTEDDLVFGRMGATEEEMANPAAAKSPGPRRVRDTHSVAEIMTPNPIAAEETTPIEELCRLMWRLKIHRIPIVRDRRVKGIVSSIDICRLIADGSANLVQRGK